MANTQKKKKMRWQSGKKRQIRKQTLWQQQCGAWQAIGPQAVGAEEVARPGMGVGDVVGVSGYLLVGGWVKRQLNEMYSLLTFDSQQKKRGNPAREKKLDKKSRETSCSPSALSLFNCRGLALVPACLGFEFRSHCQSFCSDFTEKTSTVRGGDSVLFVVLRYVSIRFISFRFSSVSSLSVFLALICCKIISFIYVLPFTWRYAVDNLFKRRQRRGATNLNKINYQTVTLTYRPGRQAGVGCQGASRESII